MSKFSDAVLLALGNSDGLKSALTPQGDTTGVRTLVGAVNDSDLVRVDRVQDVAVGDIALQVPFVPPRRVEGDLSRILPSHARTDLRLGIAGDPVWADILARVRVELVAEVDPGGVEDVVTRLVDTSGTLDEFRAQVPFLDVDEFMKHHHLKTIEDLRDAYEYLVAEFRMRAPPVFDPADPANAYGIEIAVAVLVLDSLDLTAGLRAAKEFRAATGHLLSPAGATVPGEAVAPYAVAVVLPTPGAASDPTTGDVTKLFAGEGVLSLFFPTP
ncbi:hypothetical protein [Streptomyces sp. NRRL S-350]|uniref:hypothetical protein n=1 Tax=Streptomyces sp. NRRL S-350 TaxID=1463902 RepID=UPI00131D3221|nr:hypothetical protein [Streptomyces sp. NRRL S-350]